MNQFTKYLLLLKVFYEKLQFIKLDCKNKKLYNLCIKKLKEISNEGIF